jgi:VanZ family protein
MTPHVIDHASHVRPRRVALSTYLAAAYTLLIVYASLHPFTGWRIPENGVFAYLTVWPRFIPAFDVAINVAAYMPFGLLIGLTLTPRVRRTDLLIAITVLGALLSLSMETLQALLPARVASIVDLLANIAGTFIGALAAPWLRRPGLEARAFGLRDTLFLEGRTTDGGLALLGLWLFAESNPALPFMAGWAPLPSPALPPPRFSFSELFAVLLGAFAVGLLLRMLLQPTRRAWIFLLALAAITFAVKWAAAEWLLKPELVFQWASREAMLGAAYGLTLAAFAGIARLRAQIVAAAAALALGIALAWFAKPEAASPAATLAMFGWRKGHLLTFNGLTQAVAAIWSYLALAYFAIFHRRLRRHQPFS